MNSKHLITTFLAAILFGATSTPVAIAQNSQRILPAQLESMFSDMRAKAPWNVDGPLLWGYFFFDPNRDRLQAVANELAKAGYQVVSLIEVKGRNSFRLHVEKIEVHSPSTLHARNTEFYELAARYKLASYDGMDVGPAPK